MYSVRHLQRFQMGAPYSAIVETVAMLLSRPPLTRNWLAVDKTGCVSAVREMLRRRFPHMAAIIVTGGREAGVEPNGDFCVPKLDLVSVLQLLLQNRRLKVAASLPQAKVLSTELQNFRVKNTRIGDNQSFEEWREREHDALVLAVVLAAWLGEFVAAAERDSAEEAMQDEIVNWVYRAGVKP